MLAMMDICTGAKERETEIYRCGNSSTVAWGREEERLTTELVHKNTIKSVCDEHIEQLCFGKCA